MNQLKVYCSTETLVYLFEHEKVHSAEKDGQEKGVKGVVTNTRTISARY
jgi:hypothetical protein